MGNGKGWGAGIYRRVSALFSARWLSVGGVSPDPDACDSDCESTRGRGRGLTGPARAEWEPSTSSGVLQFGNLGIGISGNGRQTRRAGDHSHSRFFAGGDEDEFTNAISLLLTREPRGGDLEAPSSASAGSPASRVAVASRGGPSDLSGSPRPCVRCELGCVPS